MLLKRNYYQKSFIIVLLIILISCFVVENASAKLPKELYYGENFEWTIESISDGSSPWLNLTDFSTVDNWYAGQSNVVGFTVFSSETIDDKEFLIGILDIGNLTIVTNDQEIGFNLVLSAYPWYGGLISLESDWAMLEDVAPFNEEHANIEYNVRDRVVDIEVDTHRITYDDGFQETELAYEPRTGILVGVNTTSGSFSISMELTYSSIPLPSATSNFPALTIASGFFVLIIVATTWRFKKKN